MERRDRLKEHLPLFHASGGEGKQALFQYLFQGFRGRRLGKAGGGKYGAQNVESQDLSLPGDSVAMATGTLPNVNYEDLR